MDRPGTALQAITFALDKIRDRGDPRNSLQRRYAFLLEWRGDIPAGASDWDTYLLWLQSDEAKKIGEQGE